MTAMQDFPKNLAYSLKNMSGFSKQTTELTPDNTTVSQNATIRQKLPPNALIDLRTLTMHATGSVTTTAGNAGKGHFPRYTSSLIEQLNVYINGTLVDPIQYYNVVYNTVADLTMGSDQMSKRHLENYDPSYYQFISDATDGTTSNLNNTLIASMSDTSKPLIINNWLGFLGTASTPVLSTGDLNSIELEIRFAPADVLWVGGDGTTTSVAGLGYTLSNIHFTIAKIIFNDPTYYEI